MTKEMPDSKQVTTATKERCYIPSEKTANASEALTFKATKKYLTDRSFETQVVTFLEFVSVTTKKNVINLPSSKHHGKSREEYIKEDQFLTKPRKKGNMENYIEAFLNLRETYLYDETRAPCAHGTNLYSFLVATKISVVTPNR